MPCDVLSFAMAAIEVLTGNVPFSDGIESHDAAAKIKAGERPSRPVGVPDALWRLIEDCWQQDPAKQPSFAQVVERLEAMPSKPFKLDELFEANLKSSRASVAADKA
ncbi:hypothetical protein HK105_206616 [Polyrhizophydium stewartii]|uniref:Protein kinase domain-containing protein n=1 Tax=Polyrhizophydium stewartii TaxID=2732419 RepID=A0ABR4N2Z5_9FUNG